jgi:hypothetical protein
MEFKRDDLMISHTAKMMIRKIWIGLQHVKKKLHFLPKPPHPGIADARLATPPFSRVA